MNIKTKTFYATVSSLSGLSLPYKAFVPMLQRVKNTEKNLNAEIEKNKDLESDREKMMKRQKLMDRVSSEILKGWVFLWKLQIYVNLCN